MAKSIVIGLASALFLIATALLLGAFFQQDRGLVFIGALSLISLALSVWVARPRFLADKNIAPKETGRGEVDIQAVSPTLVWRKSDPVKETPGLFREPGF